MYKKRKLFLIITLLLTTCFLSVWAGYDKKISNTEADNLPTKSSYAAVENTEVKTSFGGLTVQKLMSTDYFSNPKELSFNGEVDIKIVDSCEDLRNLLDPKETNNLKPLYVVMETELSNNSYKCTTNEKTFKITRNSDVFIDGTNPGDDGKINHFLIHQLGDGKAIDNDDEHTSRNNLTPILSITTPYHVLIKGFELRGGRNGVEADIHTRVHMGELIIENASEEGVLIHPIKESPTDKNSQGFFQFKDFSFLPLARADNRNPDCRNYEGNVAPRVFSDACHASFSGAVTINPANSMGIKIAHDSSVTINDDATLTINNPTIGIEIKGTLEFIGNGKLIIEDYSETGLRLEGAKLECDKFNSANPIKTSTTKAQPPIIFSNSNINTCIRNVGDFNGDGYNDFLWWNINSGAQSNRIWLYISGEDGFKQCVYKIPKITSPHYQLLGIGDFDNNHTDDILWRNETNNTIEVSFFPEDDQCPSEEKISHWVGPTIPEDLTLEGTGNFGEGNEDYMLWKKQGGNQYRLAYFSPCDSEKCNLASCPPYTSCITFLVQSASPYGIYFMNEFDIEDGYKAVAIGDFNNHGYDDIFWGKLNNDSSFFRYKLSLFSKQGRGIPDEKSVTFPQGMHEDIFLGIKGNKLLFKKINNDIINEYKLQDNEGRGDFSFGEPIGTISFVDITKLYKTNVFSYE